VEITHSGFGRNVKPGADLETANKRQSPGCASSAASLSAMTSRQASISVDCWAQGWS